MSWSEKFSSFKRLPVSRRISLVILLLVVLLLPLSIFASLNQVKFRQRAAELPATPPVSPTPVPTLTSRVFITSLTYSGNLGGLSGADAKCQERANAANLGGAWKAWLSSDTVSAESRLRQENTQFIRIDTAPIASDWNSLTRGQLQNPINITELRTANCTGWVWTNSTAKGEIRQASRNSCVNWTSDTDGGGTGDSTHADSGWTDYGASACNIKRPLYCFEQVRQVPSLYPTTIPTITPFPITAAPINQPPVISTGNLVTYFNGMLFEGYDLNTTDTLSMRVYGLPSGLTQGYCTQSIQSGQKRIKCPVNGTINDSRTTFYLNVVLSDNKGGSVQKNITLKK